MRQAKLTDIVNNWVTDSWGDGNTPPYSFFLGFEAGSGGTIGISDANMLYGGNMTSIEMVDDIEGAELLDVNNPFVAMELIDLAMPPNDPLLLSGQLVDNITVTGPGTLLLFDGEGNPAGIDEPNELMCRSEGQSLVGEITAEIAEMPSEAVSRPAAITRTTHLVYCPPEPNVPFDSNSMEDFEPLPRTMFDGGGDEMVLDERPIVYVTSDVTTNQIWTADNIYCIYGVINVRALLVIEPGTTIGYCTDPGQLRINNGGTLISCGLPDNKIEYIPYGFTEDNGVPDPAIYIEETASPATKITYGYFRYDRTGIIISNNRLDNPIENNCFRGVECGIVEYGPKLTDIVNNVFLYVSDGITVHLASQSGVADANSHILIENNTCSDSLLGITVYGVTDESKAGHVMVADNIIAYTDWYGLCFFDITQAGIYNTGYYENICNKFPSDLEEENAVIATEMPFCTEEIECGTVVYIDCLAPGSPFIDAGTQYIEDTHLMAKTDDFNGIPDDDLVNLGYHYEYCVWGLGEYVNAGVGVASGDINQDAATDWPDLQLLVHHWLWGGGDANDINNDGIVNLKDYAILAQTWYKIQGHPNIRPQVSGNPSNLSGNVDVNVVNFGPAAWRAFVLMDGQFIREIIGFNDEDAGVVRLDSNTYRNGLHTIKAVTVDYSGSITVSDEVELNFSNDLYCISKPENFEEDKDYQISAMFSEANDLRVRLIDWDGTPKWTSSTISGNINKATIPNSEFTKQIYDVAIDKYDTDWENIYKRATSKSFNLNDDYEFAIFLPYTKNSKGALVDGRKRTVAEIINSCEMWGVAYVVLYRGECTWENFIGVLSSPSIKYAYMSAHGDAFFGPEGYRTQRTFFVLSDSLVFSYYSPGFPLDAHYMEDLRLGESEQMKIVHIDACYSALFDDMARQWVWFGETGYGPILNQVFIGWQNKIAGGIGGEDWDIFGRNIWYSLGERETNFFTALNYALYYNNNSFIRDGIIYIGDDQVCFP